MQIVKSIEPTDAPTFNAMRKTLALILILFSVAGSCLAQDLAVSTRFILPEDVVQDSIQQVRFATNRIAIRWTYTETGAKRFLAFLEAHEAKKVRLVIGKFESLASAEVFRPMPPAFTNYIQWKEGWLKHRTDKLFGVSEEDAKAIVAGLKSK